MSFTDQNKVETILVKVTLQEASMLKKIRQHPNGEITVYLLGGNPVRVRLGGQEMLRYEDGADLAEQPTSEI